MVLTAIFGRAAIRLATRVIPLAIKGQFVRTSIRAALPLAKRVGRFFTQTKKGRFIAAAIGTATVVPDVRTFAKKKIKEDPSRLLLVTPAAPIIIGRELGKGVQIAKKDPKGAIIKGLKLAGLAGAAGAAAVVIPIALERGAKFTERVKAFPTKSPISTPLPTQVTPKEIPLTPAVPIETVQKVEEKPLKTLVPSVKITNKPTIIVQNASAH